MEMAKAIQLIQYPGLSAKSPTVWADLGAGQGLFTLALASVIHPGSKIFAVDRQASALSRIKAPAGIKLEKIAADFIHDEWPLPPLNGILMANSLHFVEDKISFIRKLPSYMISGSAILIVEYDFDHSNKWVPYPVSFASLKALFKDILGLEPDKLNETHSLYHNAMIYGACLRLSTH
jgi:hypothetical protein